MNRGQARISEADASGLPAPWWSRLAKGFGAYLSACGAGAAVFMTFVGIVDLVAPSPYQAGTPIWVMAANLVMGIFSIGLFGGVLLLVPFGLLLGLAKYLKLPRGWADVVLGAVGCFMASLLFAPISWDRELTVSPLEAFLALLLNWFSLIPILCGAVAGLTYWLVAGRPGRRMDG